MQWAENAYRLISLANFVVFLRYGRYRYAAVSCSRHLSVDAILCNAVSFLFAFTMHLAFCLLSQCKERSVC